MFTPKSLSTTGLVKSVNDRWQTFTVGLVINSVCIQCKNYAYKEWHNSFLRSLSFIHPEYRWALLNSGKWQCTLVQSVYASSRISCARVVCARGRFVPEEKKNVPILSSAQRSLFVVISGNLLYYLQKRETKRGNEFIFKELNSIIKSFYYLFLFFAFLPSLGTEIVGKPKRKSQSNCIRVTCISQPTTLRYHTNRPFALRGHVTSMKVMILPWKNDQWVIS